MSFVNDLAETPSAPQTAGPAKRRALALRLLSGMLTFCTAGTIALLLLAYLLPQNLRKISEPYLTLVCLSFAGRTLTFHFGMALLVACVVALLVKRWRFGAVAGVAGLIALLPTMLSYLPKHPPAPAPGSPTVRVMGLNVYFKDVEPETMVGAIRAKHPDVLVLSEYTPTAEAALLEAFGRDYPYRCLDARANTSGMAIYSRIPFAGPVKQSYGLWGQRTVSRAVLQLAGNQQIVLYALHLSAPISMGSVGWNRQQVAKLVEDVRGETLPVIVTGDFNFVETTPNFAALKQAALRSTHDLAGRGRGCTWPFRPAYRQWLPGVRIDHVMLSRQLTCTHHEVGPDAGSDHRPVIAEVAFAARPGS